MIHKLTLIQYLALIFVTTACSLNQSNIPSGYNQKSSKGIVILSLTTSGQCGYTLYVDLQRINKKLHKTIGFQDAGKDRDWTRKTGDCSSDSKEYSGKLAVIALTPGTYEIYKFSGINQHNAFASTDKFSLKFKVAKNRVTYIGNAHFTVRKDEYDFAVSDRRERDLALFKQKFPEIPEDYIIDLLEAVRFRTL